MKSKPQVGDIVRFMTRAHPSMGEPYEVIGRVEADATSMHAGNRYLNTAIGEVEVIHRAGSSAVAELVAFVRDTLLASKAETDHGGVSVVNERKAQELLEKYGALV